MLMTIDAIYDGESFLPVEPLALKPNTRVKITIETLLNENEEVASFLATAMSLQLEGPPDWSTNLDKYLYGDTHKED